MQFTGLSIKAFLEPKPGIPPTPKQIEWVEQYMKQRKIPALVQESYFPKSSSEILSKRTGAKLVPLCQSVGELPGASDYIGMIDYNVEQLIKAFGESR
jgi:ABC-type Zn uptake system ZnuABC Zn-binding protein ZnuA